MKLHPNAKSCPNARRLLIRRVREQNATVRRTADELGMSVRTAFKWLARHRDEGDQGLADRSSRPRRIPRQTSACVVRRIEQLRRKRRTTGEIAQQLGVPSSTVSVILRRLGLARLSSLEPQPPAHRYERSAPGELLHLDTKKLARIQGVGHAIHGDQSQRVRGVGWEFAHVCVDDYTRLSYTEVLPDERAETVAAFSRRAVAWYQRQHITVQRIMTDNGNGYRSHRFADLCREYGIRHLFTKPYTPKTNGKAERFIQTLTRRWAHHRPYRTSAIRTAALKAWLHDYNHQRPHRALGMRPPIARLREAREQRV
jgi:transposase InsO family protein